MFKRLFWLTIGLGLGVGASFWFMRFIRKTVERYSPERISTDMTNAVKGLRQDLRAAVSEGRQAMRDREIEIREEIASNGHSNGARADIWPAR
ncbi:MAG: hypothetical protein JOZ37_17310 [Actinobacteria bacterium]|nr:hypothetical protein [Actinomycetota bacterium]MBV8957968.1 hypothetical protein [Actinomycetota bacterium]MBV9665727.1 hypothetical protein [Actinomycetota bacterium]